MAIDKMQFKKIVKWYIFVVVVFLAIAVALVLLTFRNEISFAYHTERFLEDFSHDRIQVSDAVLQEKDAKHPNLFNAVVIGSDNTVLSKANTNLLPGEKIQFKHVKRKTWEIKGVPNVTISQIGAGTVGRWINGTLDSGILVRLIEQTQIGEKNNGNNLNPLDNTKRYDYFITSNSQGERLLLFFHWQPVKNGAAALLLGAIIIVLIIMSAWLLIALWVYKDASKRQCAGIVWGLLAIFTGVVGALAYLLYRGYHETCPNCFVLQHKSHVFCVACSYKMSDTCKKCNSVIGAKDVYCAHCGKRVEETKK